jgi:serine/threonine protein kinase
MGNCFHICPSDAVEESPKSNALTTKDDWQDSTNLSTVRQNMLFTPSNRGDISKYYQVLKVLGEGSMGSVSLVKKRKEYVGGSAYTKQRRGFFGRIVSERSAAPADVIHDGNSRFYALKSIILSRVSVSMKVNN